MSDTDDIIESNPIQTKEKQNNITYKSFQSINEAENGGHLMKGLGLLTTSVFIIGEMTGTGILSLPKAMLQSDWSGIALILGCCVLSAYCGIRLASCWILILSKNESFRLGVRDPFPIIAYEAAGKAGRYIVLASSYLQLFGAGVIFLLLASENVANILNNQTLHFCDWTFIITAVIFPISMLGTPKDFWPIAVGAMACTGVACIFIFTQSMRQLTDPLPEHNPLELKEYFLAFGTILFCWGGAVMFPTIQTDMQNPSLFPKAVILAYISMLFFYLPVAIGCFIAFGYQIKDNIIGNLDDNWLKTTVLVLITGHLLTAFNIILNPVFQGAEQAFNAPTKFGIKRVLIRGGVLLLVLFVAQSVPNFGPILSLIGGSTISLSSFILPCVFYYLLCKQTKYNIHIGNGELVALAVCIFISSVGGIASTFFSIDALFSSKTFIPPCYLNRTQII